MESEEIYTIKKVEEGYIIENGYKETVSRSKLKKLKEHLKNNLDSLEKDIREIKTKDLDKEFEKRMEKDKEGLSKSLNLLIADVDKMHQNILEENYMEIISPILESKENQVKGIQESLEKFDIIAQYSKKNFLINVKAELEQYENQYKNDKKIYDKYKKVLSEK